MIEQPGRLPDFCEDLKKGRARYYRDDCFMCQGAGTVTGIVTAQQKTCPLCKGRKRINYLKPNICHCSQCERAYLAREKQI